MVTLETSRPDRGLNGTGDRSLFAKQVFDSAPLPKAALKIVAPSANKQPGLASGHCWKMQEAVEILLITGPAGIGKSTLCWEIGARLAAAEVPHAVIETDELDRVFPRPTLEQLNSLRPGTTDVSALNLAAMWATYRALGHTRLVMSGVMMHLQSDCRWISSAIPGARITAVRLIGSESTLVKRLDQREIGSGRDEQAQRSLRQLKRISNEPPGASIVVRIDDRTPAQLAQIVLRAVRW